MAPLPDYNPDADTTSSCQDCCIGCQISCACLLLVLPTVYLDSQHSRQSEPMKRVSYQKTPSCPNLQWLPAVSIETKPLTTPGGCLWSGIHDSDCDFLPHPFHSTPATPPLHCSSNRAGLSHHVVVPCLALPLGNSHIACFFAAFR